MAHVDWFISGLQKVIFPLKKFILPARVNIVLSEFYYSGETSDLNMFDTREKVA